MEKITVKLKRSCGDCGQRFAVAFNGEGYWSGDVYLGDSVEEVLRKISAGNLKCERCRIYA